MEGEPKSREEGQETERTSGLMRVVGVSPEEEKKILAERKEVFNDQKIQKAEREKTPEELEIINGILKSLPKFIKKYGGVMPPIVPNNIHVGEYGSLTPEQKEYLEETRGGYSPESQLVAVITDRESENNLVFASRLAHELIHFCSFQSSTANPEKRTLSHRREGFVIRVKNNDEREIYFRDINEAITEELLKRFDEEYFKSIPALEEDVQKRDKGRKRTPDLSYYTEKTIREESGLYRCTITAHPYTYKDERKRLWEIIDRMQQENPKQFESGEDVFEVFAEAYFTSRLLKIAKMVEAIYGKGSFRRIGEKTKAKKRNQKIKNK